MNQKEKTISPVLFVVVVVCFFLPFINVSCSGQKLLSVTGMELVTGKSLDSGMFKGSEGKSRIPGELWAQLAFVAAILGVGTAFLKTDSKGLFQLLLGAAGVVLLLLLRGKIGSDLGKEGESMKELLLGFDVGYWLALVGFAAASLVHLLPEREKPPQPPPG